MMLHFYNVKSPMRYRTFGRTGIELSTVSLGCNRLGDPGIDPATWPPIVERGLPLAMRHNVGIMVRTPLARGLLTGKFKLGVPIPAEQHWRRPKGDQLQLRLERMEQLRFLERPGQTLGQAALRFALAHPAVHCVVPGALTIEQLESNVPAAGADLSHDDMERIRQLHCEWRAEGRW